MALKEMGTLENFLIRMCGTEESQVWYGWPDTAARTDVKKPSHCLCPCTVR
jgi:hypothetical protein